MEKVVIASSQADARAAEAVEQHHAQMAGTLRTLVEALVVEASAGDREQSQAARDALVGWCEAELVPHAMAEEEAMYPAAHVTVEGRLLVEGMLAEHQVISGLVRTLRDVADPVRAAAAAEALVVMFESHLAKENELVLPLLVSRPDVSVEQLLGGMHELLGAPAAHSSPDATPEAEAGCGGHGCACGEEDAPGYPELDARAVPHAIRHATIFGALDAVRPGAGMVLVAPHDPVPLLAQIEERAPGTFEVGYLERGPEVWRLAFVRRTAA